VPVEQGYQKDTPSSISTEL